MVSSCLQSILYSHLDYKLISKNAVCKKTPGGGWLNRCYCIFAECPGAGGCEKACSSYDWCVAYGDKGYLPGNKPGCYLFSPRSSCPGSWKLSKGEIATASEIVASNIRSEYSCVVKLGKVSK